MKNLSEREETALDELKLIRNLRNELVTEIDRAKKNIAIGVIDADFDLEGKSKEEVFSALRNGDYESLPQSMKTNKDVQNLMHQSNMLDGVKDDSVFLENKVGDKGLNIVNGIKSHVAVLRDRVVSAFTKACEAVKGVFARAKEFLAARNDDFERGISNVVEAFHDAGDRATEMIQDAKLRVSEIYSGLAKDLTVFSEKSQYSAGGTVHAVTQKAEELAAPAKEKVRHVSDIAKLQASRAIANIGEKSFTAIDRQYQASVEKSKEASRLRTAEQVYGDIVAGKDIKDPIEISYEALPDTKKIENLRNKALEISNSLTKNYESRAKGLAAAALMSGDGKLSKGMAVTFNDAKAMADRAAERKPIHFGNER